ncbi:PHB depolymerase family esterase [Microbulbifer sp. ARAS458-1]|uniref:extracellular catalytic domain type 1 short-chain-length polyhydroxyalkanoate depolymerase n=1 Tax=Microbulbifer sp. ARAS458-1 TaxID=3140242 RepID=UPI0038783966
MKPRSLKGSGTFCRVLFISIVTSLFISTQSHAGNWTTEHYLAGMDSVHIYVPTTAPLINNKRALMINLHGCSMSNTDMKNNADWKPTADQFGMIIALPDVPGLGASNISCWDYYGENHTRSNKHNNEIINLAIELTSRTALNIDPNQVYITGFSSGGGQANVIACLAPDIFAGVGSSAGPGLGTTTYQYASVPWNYSDANAAAHCADLAGSNNSHLETQIYSTIHGNADSTVDPGFNQHGANIMSLVYGATSEGPATSIAGGGTKVIFSDTTGPRVSRISVSGMGHDWSTGNGGNSGYFVNTKVDYPNYVTQWFFDNNRRIGGTSGNDSDGDGFSSGSDCNDQDASINPAATEICDDGIDQNCSGSDLACNTWTCKEYTTANTYHYNSTPQRATVWYFNWVYHYYAKGSGEELTFPGPYSYNTISETSEGYFEAGSCP